MDMSKKNTKRRKVNVCHVIYECWKEQRSTDVAVKMSFCYLTQNNIQKPLSYFKK